MKKPASNDTSKAGGIWQKSKMQEKLTIYRIVLKRICCHLHRYRRQVHTPLCVPIRTLRVRIDRAEFVRIARAHYHPHIGQEILDVVGRGCHSLVSDALVSDVDDSVVTPPLIVPPMTWPFANVL